MNILLFPTRFFPAISGGDFYIQRLGEEFRRQHHFPQVITSTAIDFAAVHGLKGREVQPRHRAFGKYHEVNIRRFKVEQIVLSKNDVLSQTVLERPEAQKFYQLCKQKLNISEKALTYFFQNGPILPELTEILQSSTSASTTDELLKLSNEKKLQTENISKNDRFNIIHCSYLPYANLIYTLLIAQHLHIPSVVTPFLHESNQRYQDSSIFEVLALFDAVIACTIFEKESLVSKGIDAGKIHILPMGVDVERFQPDYRSLAHENYQLQNPLVLFCGYKNYEKGALTLLKAIPSIHREMDDVSFMFIGPPTKAFNYTLKAVKKEVPAVHIVNVTPENLSGIYDKKKIGAFQTADLFCMPSRSDAYGIAYLEAWACSTPVIAADFSAMHEVVAVNRDGMLVQFDKIDDLREKILGFLKNPERAANMGKQGFEKVQSENRWQTIAQNTHEIYQTLITAQK